MILQRASCAVHCGKSTVVRVVVHGESLIDCDRETRAATRAARMEGFMVEAGWREQRAWWMLGAVVEGSRLVVLWRVEVWEMLGVFDERQGTS
jgi:hypothetical protein